MINFHVASTLTLTAVLAFTGELPSCSHIGSEIEPGKTWRSAKQESNLHPVVTVIIFGQKKHTTGKQIGERIQTKLTNRDVPTKYYLAREDLTDITVAAFLKGKLHTLTKEYEDPEIVDSLSAEFTQAWPDYGKNQANTIE